MFRNFFLNLKTKYLTSRFLGKVFDFFLNTKTYFLTTKKFIAKQSKKDQKGPFNLVIETTNLCNAHCLMCPRSKLTRKKTTMKDEVFEKIFARIAEEKIPIANVFLSGFGEPFLDRKFLDRIKFVKEKGFRVKFYTNASLLTEKVSLELIESKVDEVNISVNGASRRNYEKIMGLNFNENIKNIEEFIKHKKKNNSVLPLIRVSSILINENQEDVKEHVKKWSRLADSVTVSQPHQWGGSIKVISNCGFKKANMVYPCRSLWHTMVIDTEGNFVVCCRDFNSKYVVGKILKNSFREVYGNKLFAEFRRKHLFFEKEKLPKICQECNFPYQKGVEWYLPTFIS